jgi:hypothetical protein
VGNLLQKSRFVDVIAFADSLSIRTIIIDVLAFLDLWRNQTTAMAAGNHSSKNERLGDVLKRFLVMSLS